MSGSNNQNKKRTSYNKGSGGGSARKSNPSKGNSRKKQNQEQEETSFAAEITVWVICAVMLMIELGNFGLCGFINNISRFFFGVFGMIEYILPLTVMFAAFFLHINEYKKRAVQKVIFGFCVLLCFGMIAQLAVGIDEYDFSRLFKEGFDDQLGGGILCGSIAYLLHRGVGLVGTYIIIILAIILCVVLFAEISVIDFIKKLAGTVREKETDANGEMFSEEPSKSRKQERKKSQKKDSDFQEIVRED